MTFGRDENKHTLPQPPPALKDHQPFHFPVPSIDMLAIMSSLRIISVAFQSPANLRISIPKLCPTLNAPLHTVATVHTIVLYTHCLISHAYLHFLIDLGSVLSRHSYPSFAR